MPLPISPLLVALLLLGLLSVLLVGREVTARVDAALGAGVPTLALGSGALAGAAVASGPVTATYSSRLLRVQAGGGGAAALVFGLVAGLGVTAVMLASVPRRTRRTPYSSTQAAVGAVAGAALGALGVAGVGVAALLAVAGAFLVVPAAALAATRALLGGPASDPRVRWGAVLVPAVLLLAAPHDAGLAPGPASLAAAAAALAAAAVLPRLRSGRGPPAALAVGALGLAHGASDVANVLGPLVAAVEIVDAGAPVPAAGVPLDLRLLAAGALVGGLLAWAPEGLDPAPPSPDGGGEGQPVAALAAGAALPLALATAAAVPASTTTAVLGAAAGLRSGPDRRPWRPVARGALAWPLLAGASTWLLTRLLSFVLL